jgi:hypothetical protein
LLQGSFVPERAQRELRELTRYRLSLVQERTAEANRLQKTLEGSNMCYAPLRDQTGSGGNRHSRCVRSSDARGYRGRQY